MRSGLPKRGKAAKAARREYQYTTAVNTATTGRGYQYTTAGCSVLGITAARAANVGAGVRERSLRREDKMCAVGAG